MIVINTFNKILDIFTDLFLLIVRKEQKYERTSIEVFLVDSNR